MQYKLMVLRKENGITQEQMAKIAGTGRSNYGQKENDKLPFDLDEMFAISSYFNKPINEIFLPRTCQNGIKKRTKKEGDKNE